MSERSTVRGPRFFFQLAGGALAAGLIFFVIAAIFLKTLFAVGILGFFVLLFIFAAVWGWVAKRRAAETAARYSGSE